MPFYRTSMGFIHMRGTKLPKPCAASILIAAGKHTRCCAISAYLCDGASAAEVGKTCDMPLCEAHAREIDRNRHLCPACHLQHTQNDPQKGLFTELLAQ